MAYSNQCMLKIRKTYTCLDLDKRRLSYLFFRESLQVESHVIHPEAPAVFSSAGLKNGKPSGFPTKIFLRGRGPEEREMESRGIMYFKRGFTVIKVNRGFK